ncbi:MAG: hypothetical protein ACOC4G_08375 [Bacillota bacterium]
MGISLSEQLLFYLPMALTSVLIITTHSLFNAALARLPSPELFISAFAVAKSFMHFFTSPIIMIRQTVSTLVRDTDSYKKVRRFIFLIVLSVVLLLALLRFSSLADWMLKNIMGVGGEVRHQSLIIFGVLILFPLGPALRDFMQGIAVKLNRTYLFSIATVIRITYVLAIIYFIDYLNFIPAAFLAGGMFLGAVLIEGIVLFAGVKLTTRNIPRSLDKNEDIFENNIKKLNYKKILYFYHPLLITSFLKRMGAPLINMGLARTIRPELSISVYAVAWGLGLIFLSPIFMFHQQVINFLDDKNNNLASLKRFGFIIALIITLFLGVTGFTDLGYYILKNWIQATEEICLLSLDLLKIMIVLPAIMIGREFYWGVMMKKNKTKFISRGKMVNLTALFITIVLGILINPANSAIVGIAAVIFSQLFEFLYLYYKSRKNSVI